MEESDRDQFLAKYGPREHVLKMIQDNDTHPWTRKLALMNPAITHDDLTRLAYHSDHNVSYAAIARARQLGIEVSFSKLGKS